MKHPRQQIQRCAIYTRKSIAKGLDQEYNSLDAQEDFCMNFIARHSAEGWVCVGTYCDAAVSGTTVEREQLTRLRQQVKAHAVDRVVVYKLDCLSRDLADFTILMKEFADNGVSFVSATQALEAHTPEGKLSMNMMAVVADYEAAMIRARIRDKLRATREKGLWVGGCPPFGYRMEDKKLSIDPKTAPTVRSIFNLYLEGSTMSDLARLLNSKPDMPPPGRTSVWCGQTVRRILSNPVYCGYLKGEGEELIRGIHVPIINYEVWQEVARRLEENKRIHAEIVKKTAPIFALRGLLTCARCGRAYIGVRAKSASSVWHRYYTCSSGNSHGCTFCGNARFNATQLEQFLARYIMLTFKQDPTLFNALISEMRNVTARDLSDALSSMDLQVDKLTPQELKPLLHAVFRSISIGEHQLDICLRNFPEHRSMGIPGDYPAMERMSRLIASPISPNEQGGSLALDGSRVLHNKLAAVTVPDGFDFSIPIIRERRSTNSQYLRVRTREDDMLASAAGPGCRPTPRAIRMANAIMVERLLTSGKFGSATQLARMIGVSQLHITTMLNLLNLPPEEIEKLLFETR